MKRSYNWKYICITIDTTSDESELGENNCINRLFDSILHIDSVKRFIHTALTHVNNIRFIVVVLFSDRSDVVREMPNENNEQIIKTEKQQQ